ncbi:hypothetical protein AOZ06_08295 [Kibdelosporangium phytohabitans]|uniref:Uncharacterized protein n=1 Tax=Kibdelosporangium phytohabitans TaxID=860235 RepID=A0A0N9HYG3_9PSEU|nr:hypothetical protein AOZ06_08295 [Kibdelosporangium phytohabitans]
MSQQASLDMSAVYGLDWPRQVRNLARYFAKHIGSRIAHDRFPVPPSLGRFLDGAHYAHDVQMVLFKSDPHYQMYLQARRDGLDGRGLWMEPALGMVSTSTQRLTRYSSSLIINFVGVFYRWNLLLDPLDPFYNYQGALLHWRHDLPVT